MKKSDIAIVIGLFLLLLAWPAISPKLFPKAPQPPPAPEGHPARVEGGVTNEPPVLKAGTETSGVSEVSSPASVSTQAPPAVVLTSLHAGTEPVKVSVTGASVRIDVSSWGGGIVSAAMTKFPSTLTRDSGPVVMNFDGFPSLSYSGLSGLDTNCDFEVTSSNGVAHVTRSTGDGLVFHRTISLTNEYRLRIVDRFSNGSSGKITLPEHGVRVGPMRNNPGETPVAGMPYLGIDSQATHGGEDARNWVSGGPFFARSLKGEITLPESFEEKDRRGGCLGPCSRPAMTKWYDPGLSKAWPGETDWVAVKNKFFIQILMPRNDVTGESFVMHARRKVRAAELRCTSGPEKGRVLSLHPTTTTLGSAAGNDLVVSNASVTATNCIFTREGWNFFVRPVAGQVKVNNEPVSERRLNTHDTIQVGDLTFTFFDAERPDVRETWSDVLDLEEVSATMVFAGRDLEPSASFAREFDYYVGPKIYCELKEIRKESVLEFGIWSFFCKVLILVMGAIHSVVPNYGLVIILLTILIRLVFWPVMQKSAENSRKMQEIQPELAALREQYKDNQQEFLRKQQELFKKHKVSILGGCLPMLIQLPILFALFVVLRSSVELRFAPFLWITDLSEPERLFAGIIPFWPHHVNILPILMTVVQIWQMKITPTPGDPAQQKIMMIFMPIFMLFLLYDMASGLVLYWTVSQLLAILQMVLQKKKNDGRKVVQAAAAKGR